MKKLLLTLFALGMLFLTGCVVIGYTEKADLSEFVFEKRVMDKHYFEHLQVGNKFVLPTLVIFSGCSLSLNGILYCLCFMQKYRIVSNRALTWMLGNIQRKNSDLLNKKEAAAGFTFLL